MLRFKLSKPCSVRGEYFTVWPYRIGPTHHPAAAVPRVEGPALHFRLGSFKQIGLLAYGFLQNTLCRPVTIDDSSRHELRP